MRKPPRLCVHRASGLAYVTDPRTKREVYFGPADSPEAHARYAKWLAGWREGREGVGKESGRYAKTVPDAPLTVSRLCDLYLQWAAAYYRKRGKPTSEVGVIVQATDRLVKRSGPRPAASYGPLDLTAYRDALAAERHKGEPLSRAYVNKLVSHVRRVWAWAVAREMLPPERLMALRAVPGLRKGRSQAREPDRVRPVSVEVVSSTLPYLHHRLRVLVLLQLYTGCRPGEAVVLRPCDVDRSVVPWEWRPVMYKTEHHEQVGERVVYLGPRAREVVAPLLDGCRGGNDYVFRTRGRGPARCRGNPLREASYAKQLRDAIRRANRGTTGPPLLPLPHWTPLQLRHAAATAVRAAYGLEAVQSVLGHERMATSEIYAERLSALGREAAEALG